MLRENTLSAFGDLDASPTKAWVALNCEKDPSKRQYFNFAFSRRPAEELYDLKTDPDQVYNFANVERYAEIKSDLSERLMKTLKETGDPRVTGDGTTFDKAPFASELKKPARKPAPKK